MAPICHALWMETCALCSMSCIAFGSPITAAAISEASAAQKASSKAGAHFDVSVTFAVYLMETEAELATADTNDLISTVAVVSGFARLMAEKLLLLEGKDLTNGGCIETEDGRVSDPGKG